MEVASSSCWLLPLSPCGRVQPSPQGCTPLGCLHPSQRARYHPGYHGAGRIPGHSATQPPGASPPLPAPARRAAPVRAAAPSSPPPEGTPLPQPLQMAARRLTQADRLSAPGQMGPAPVSSFPHLFPSLYALFPSCKPPRKHHPPGWGRGSRARPGQDFPTPQPEAGAGRSRGCTEFLGRPCSRVRLCKGTGGCTEEPPLHRACWKHCCCRN